MNRFTDKTSQDQNGVAHVIGCGVAGLACAVQLAASGRRVAVYDSASQAGGRCRSYYDAKMDRRIDNGNHLVLSGNDNVFRFLRLTGGENQSEIASRAAYPFLNLRDGARWTIRPNRGLIPWWVFDQKRRVPGTRPADYLSIFRLGRADASDTIDDIFPKDGPIYERLWEPLAVGVLNAPPSEAAARLLWPVMTQTFGRGENACRPCHFPNGLAAAFIDPAIALLKEKGNPVRFGSRLRSLLNNDDRVTALQLTQGDISLGEHDHVVLATPPAVGKEIQPSLKTPQGSRAIVNAHFRLPHTPALPEGAKLLGLIGGVGQWLFIRDDVVSVTVSAANDLGRRKSDEIAALLWPEVKRALQIKDDAGGMPPHRIIKEKQATFSQTPASLNQRQATVTGLANLFVAGDWTDTGLPATIEGAILSGFKAAKMILSSAR